MMSHLKITSKGQVMLRTELLKHLGVQAGQKVTVEYLPDGRMALKAAPTGTITTIFDALKRDAAPRLTLEEIAAIGKEGWAGRAGAAV